MAEKMDRELRDKWVAALRSGEYEQGTGWLLKIGDDGKKRYCCLGVLSEVCGVEWGEPGASGEIDPIEGYRGLVPKSLGGVLHDKYEAYLSTMNDVGSTFEEIADWIEENL